MDLNIISPKFTEDVLNEIIRNAGGTKCTSWRFGTGFKKGDSYMSELFRLIVEGGKSDGSKFELKMIVKALPKNIARSKTFRSADFFRNECSFYNIVLAKYLEFQESKNIPNAFKEVPKCYYAYFDNENDFIALEDLSYDGYGSACRQNGLDLKHCKLIMKTLGRYHAVSLAIKDQEPKEFNNIINSIEETYYAKQFKDWHMPLMNKEIEIANEAISKIYGGTIYETKMKELTENNLYDTMVALTHKRGPYSVIGHGDCWIPNFLMKFDTATMPTASKIIDFQLVRYASPALDISFFIYSCTSQDLRKNHYDELLQVYHTAASELLITLGTNPDKVFPYSALIQEMKESARFGVAVAMEAIPLSVMDDGETADLDNIEGDTAIPLSDVWTIRPIKDDEDKRRLADVFKHATEQGYLD